MQLRFFYFLIFCDRILIVPAEKLPASLRKDMVSVKLPAELAHAKDVIILDPAGRAAVKDAASPSGKAIPEIFDAKKTFTFGIYNRISKKYGRTRRLAASEVPADGKYHMVCLDKKFDILAKDATLFGGRWILLFKVGEQAIPGTKYQIWLSLKQDNGKLFCGQVYLAADK